MTYKKNILENLREDEEISNQVIEKLLIEVAEFFNNTRAEAVELSALMPGLMHNPRLETVFEYLGYEISYPENSDFVIRVRRPQ